MFCRLRQALLISTTTVALGCRDGDLPSFSLLDVNPNSDRYGEQVASNDYTKQVTGWYFIHAT